MSLVQALTLKAYTDNQFSAVDYYAMTNESSCADFPTHRDK